MPPSSALQRRMGEWFRRDKIAKDRARDAKGDDGNSSAAAPGSAGAQSGSAAALPSDKAEALYREGVQQVREGSYREAVTTFSRAIFLAPGEPLPFVARGEAYAAMCDLRSAISNFRKALTLLRDPVVAEDVKTRLAHLIDATGVASLRRGEAKRAMHFFVEAIRESDEPIFELHRCLCLVALGQHVEADVALTALLQVSRDADAAAAASKSAKALPGGDTSTGTKPPSDGPSTPLRRSDLPAHHGASTPSNASLQARKDQNHRSGTPLGSDDGGGGGNARHDGEPSDDEQEDEDAEEAANNVRKARQAVDAEARVLLVHLALLGGDFAKARNLLESCLQRHYGHPRVQDMEARFDSTFQQLRADSEASLDVDGLTRCITCFPDDAELYRVRALAYIRHKAYTLAVQDLFSCLQKSGGTSPVASALMASTLGTIADELAQAEDYQAAVNYYGESLKWVAANADVYIARADCLVQLGKHEAALTDYKAALAMDPASDIVRSRLAQLHGTWGMVLYNQARYKLAETEFGRAIGYDDGNPTYPYHRALTRLMLKEQLLAARDLLTCRQLRATDPNIAKLVNQICGDAWHGATMPAGASSTSGGHAGGTPALIATAGAEAAGAKAAQRMTLGRRLGLPLQAATVLRGVKGDLVAEVVEAETTMGGLRSDRASLLQQTYNPTVIRNAAAARAPRPKPALDQGEPTPLGPVGAAALMRPRGSSASQHHHHTASSSVGRSAPHATAAAPASSSSAPPARPARMWAGAASIVASRLNRVEVSKAEPVPELYTQQRLERERRLVEEVLLHETHAHVALEAKLAMGQSGVPPPPPAHVAQARNAKVRIRPRGPVDEHSAATEPGTLHALLSQQRKPLETVTRPARQKSPVRSGKT
jgi:tetratricopeptide (TPR) repeat protein